MSIKMIITDLDGTLLRKDKTISNYTISVFRQCQEMNIKTVLATARPIRAVEMFKYDRLFDAAIYHNGAVVKIDSMNVLRCGISPEETEVIISSALQANSTAKLCVEIDDKLYGNYDPSDLWPGVEINQTDFTDLPTIPADKIIMPMTTIAELNTVAEVLPNSLYIEMSENTIGMVMNRNATKSKATQYLAKHYNLSLSDIIAFGDDFNDIEMLQICGIGVAVENAIDEVKSVADCLCGTNDCDGVAKWLEENLF